METAEKRNESTEEVGAVSMSPSTSLLASDVLAKMLQIQSHESRWDELAAWLRGQALLRPCRLCGRRALLLWDSEHVCCSDDTCLCPNSDGSMTIDDWNKANCSAFPKSTATFR